MFRASECGSAMCKTCNERGYGQQVVSVMAVTYFLVHHCWWLAVCPDRQPTLLLFACLCSQNKPPLGTPRKIGQGCKWHSFTTNTYKLHFLESPSGIKVGSPGSRSIEAIAWSILHTRYVKLYNISAVW